jgi:hypothetical protein
MCGAASPHIKTVARAPAFLRAGWILHLWLHLIPIADARRRCVFRSVVQVRILT